MAIITGDATDGVRTGLAGRIANQLASDYAGINFPVGSLAAKGLNSFAHGIVNALNGDKVDGTTQVTGGGGGGGGAPSSLHTTTPRRFAMWQNQSDSQTDMVGFAIQNPTISPGGGRALVFGSDRVWTQFNFNNVVNGFTGYTSPNHWTWLLLNCKFSARIRLNYLPNNAAIIEIYPSNGTAAWSGSYVPTINSSNADANAFVAIGYDSRVGSNWIWGHCSGGLANWTDSGIPVSTTDDFLLTFESVSQGASVKVTVTNCTSSATATATFSSNLPTTTSGCNVAIGSVAWAASGLGTGPWYEYVYMEQN